MHVLLFVLFFVYAFTVMFCSHGCFVSISRFVYSKTGLFDVTPLIDVMISNNIIMLDNFSTGFYNGYYCFWMRLAFQ